MWIKALDLYTVYFDEPSRYETTGPLGHGANSNVRLAYKIKNKNHNFNNSKKVAIKQIKKRSIAEDPKMVTQLKNEIQSQRILAGCSNILQLNKVFESQNSIYLFFDFQEGGTLLDIITEKNSLQEKDLQIIMGQILLVVDFMHSHNIVHRDLKLDNILVRSKQEGQYDIRIADFGLSCQIQQGQKLTDICGTPSYIAPEILNNQPYDIKSDIFGVGSIMYNIMSGRYLFNGDEKDNVLYQNKLCFLGNIFKYLGQVSDEAQDLLLKLLEKNPEQRLSAREALQHPWFKTDRQALNACLFLNEQISTSSINYFKLPNMSQPIINQNQGFSFKSITQGNRNLHVSKNSMKINNSKSGSFMSYFDMITSNRQDNSNTFKKNYVKEYTRIRKQSDSSPQYEDKKSLDSCQNVQKNQSNLQIRFFKVHQQDYFNGNQQKEGKRNSNMNQDSYLINKNVIEQGHLLSLIEEISDTNDENIDKILSDASSLPETDSLIFLPSLEYLAQQGYMYKANKVQVNRIFELLTDL
ncbi:serine threonine protein kinase [Stylonychia lemnae]|uniref:Serine threonine protein kinase n=1 Tax=Stylonychia lemnae TaxID=5949 RepID=A0A078ATE9_STYLE|nr:serine threonine protein kinase [Stylonychia lemnae]|eukprot:CDW85720.1 serine threonine protein kinase [Stylonychia lemnae]